MPDFLPTANTPLAVPPPVQVDVMAKSRKRYMLTIAYDGTAFHGWQKQTPPDRDPLRTVAGVVEDALRHVLRQPLDLVGASRTDAGVHAQGQVAHFDADTSIPLEKIASAVNSRLPDDVENPIRTDRPSHVRCDQRCRV